MTDWPSGPSTIHIVGTAAAGPAPWTTSLCQIWGRIASVASRLIPNIA